MPSTGIPFKEIRMRKLCYNMECPQGSLVEEIAKEAKVSQRRRFFPGRKWGKTRVSARSAFSADGMVFAKAWKN